jgi:hypothetical protein
MAEPMFKVIEHGPHGQTRELLNTSTTPPTGTFTRARAEATVAWREAHLSRRYTYEIVEAG